MLLFSDYFDYFDWGLVGWRHDYALERCIDVSTLLGHVQILYRDVVNCYVRVDNLLLALLWLLTGHRWYNGEKVSLRVFTIRGWALVLTLLKLKRIHVGS